MASGGPDTYASLMALPKDSLKRRCQREHLVATGNKHDLVGRLLRYYAGPRATDGSFSGTDDDSFEGFLARQGRSAADLLLLYVWFQFACACVRCCS